MASPSRGAAEAADARLAASTSAGRRVFILLDADAFYAQVEAQRLGLPASVPLAVRQWDGLIAVNYAARACGVTRCGKVTQRADKPRRTLARAATTGQPTARRNVTHA